ncbi:unnamed protein product [Paramecium octaurelia]|uniref:Uncharacterized protein n=1 Tax=Paramecium octaurelia TaxID=43137 RepID=A0A8S1W8R2_PAROT|nr:unnamed protein product [Paramecium octaurelia]
MKELGSIKIGTWIELSASFYYHKQTIFQGEYKNGQKLGNGSVVSNILIYKAIRYMRVIGQLYNYLQKFFLYFFRRIQKQKKICFQRYIKFRGGGLYDLIKDKGSIKNGNWIELSDGYFSEAQLTYKGEYKNNQKLVDGILDIGRMDGFLFERMKDTIKNFSGGGLYSLVQGTDSIKIGKWVEFTAGFFCKSQVIYKGEYLNGNKIGIWDNLFRNEISEQFHLIGGELYYLREELGSFKGGKWIELSENYGNGVGLSEVIYVGQYQNGKKSWNLGGNEKRQRYDARKVSNKKVNQLKQLININMHNFLLQIYDTYQYYNKIRIFSSLNQQMKEIKDDNLEGFIVNKLKKLSFFTHHCILYENILCKQKALQLILMAEKDDNVELGENHHMVGQEIGVDISLFHIARSLAFILKVGVCNKSSNKLNEQKFDFLTHFVNIDTVQKKEYQTQNQNWQLKLKQCFKTRLYQKYLIEHKLIQRFVNQQ